MPPFESDSYESFDVDSVVSDIASSLSPNAGEGDSPRADESASVESGESPSPAPAPVSSAPAPSPAPDTGITPGQNSVAKALPKAWKKDMAPHWEKLPPEVHDYVYAREEDVMRGIQRYQSQAQQWNSLIEPFAPIFQQHADVKPVELMQSLMNTHLRLLNPSIPPEQKAQLAQQILSDYGISLDPANQPPAEARLQQELQTLRSELNQIRSGLTQRQQAEYESGVQKQLDTVNAFAADPKNEFFNEVGPDILRFVQTGVAKDLASAYEMACWANPAIRAKMLAKQQAPAPVVNTPRAKNGQFVNIGSDNTPPTRTRIGSIDDTINSVIAAHAAKH